MIKKTYIFKGQEVIKTKYLGVYDISFVMRDFSEPYSLAAIKHVMTTAVSTYSFKSKLFNKWLT